MNNILKLARNQLKDRETCVEWLKDLELIPRSKKCPRCKKEMKWRARGTFGQFRCRGKHGSLGDYEVCVSKDTWFENIKVSPEKAVLLVYAFANNYNYQKRSERHPSKTSHLERPSAIGTTTAARYAWLPWTVATKKTAESEVQDMWWR